MFDLYHAPAQADYRQHELYEKIANDRLARKLRAPTPRPRMTARRPHGESSPS